MDSASQPDPLGAAATGRSALSGDMAQPREAIPACQVPHSPVPDHSGVGVSACQRPPAVYRSCHTTCAQQAVPARRARAGCCWQCTVSAVRTGLQEVADCTCRCAQCHVQPAEQCDSVFVDALCLSCRMLCRPAPRLCELQKDLEPSTRMLLPQVSIRRYADGLVTEAHSRTWPPGCWIQRAHTLLVSEPGTGEDPKFVVQPGSA